MILECTLKQSLGEIQIIKANNMRKYLQFYYSVYSWKAMATFRAYFIRLKKFNCYFVRQVSLNSQLKISLA